MISQLQQFILEECVEQRGSCSRSVIDKNQRASKSKAQKEHFKKITTQSIERLIDRGLIVGYGMKTKEKLFITKIRVTPAGKREVARIRKAKQRKLPLKKYVRNKNPKL
ncbi:hypothetical protein CL632_01805 [bacterium]|jgi:hypothetical protein|nr:hypothetical protein [bacterium]MDP6571446.1 hypothetical protein [Patescibacteria group bacterium]MDP6756101.1 hypothetical protein [Patescibacteria group bacterium]|tara:strand:- start:4441 stop:4767 length:327 start_codon:yes stop_codon:yes gene_type:complete